MSEEELTPMTCQRCSGPMETGFIMDYVAEAVARRQSLWVPGEPQTNWLGIVKDASALPVTTYRCTDCGWLDSYALPK